MGKATTINTITSLLKAMSMKVLSAWDAKHHFGEFLDAVRREPVVTSCTAR